MSDIFIERRIVTGLIVSTEYITRIRKFWSVKLLEASAAKLLATWCIDFYDKYGKAPGEEIQSIFHKNRKAMDDDDAEDIKDVLNSLSDEYERADKFNVNYLIDQTVQYFDEQNLTTFTETITRLLEEGKVVEARNKAQEFTPSILPSDRNMDLSDPLLVADMDRIFKITSDPVVVYPKQLGEFWNDQLVRGGFVALMAPEKRGKTFWLLDIAMRAARDHVNVAFFQAGDMTKEQQILRACIYLAKKSNKEKYCEEHYEPVRDCIWNQLDQCNKKERECDFGIFDEEDESFINKVTLSDLIKAHEENPKYKACHNCSEYRKQKWGAVWISKVPDTTPLTAEEAKPLWKQFFIDTKRRMKLSTHPSRTLTVAEIDSTLDMWEKEDGFVADLIVIDYADIMAPEIKADFRHQENDRWMRLRGLSEKRHALVITATQTDSKSYEENRLSLKNFSEDKRKFGHVTAMYGLNQDKVGREKKIGLMRINQIVVREDEFYPGNEVVVLQNLKRGQPYLGSYWPFPGISKKSP